MSSVSFTLDTSVFEAKIHALKTETLPRAGAVLKEFADNTMAYAKQTMDQRYSSGRYVTGTLRDSGRVEEPVYQGTSVMVEASFGKDGPASQYALHVHEGHHLVMYGHDTGIEIPATKFWEIPLMEKVNDFEKEVGVPIGVEIQRLWGGR